MKLSTKKNHFPHTFSKAPCSGMQLFRTSRGRVHPPLGSGKLVSRAIRICVRMSGARARKGGSGKNTYGVNSLAGHTYLRAHVGGARKERGEW